MNPLAILSAKKLITLSAVGVLSLATAGGVILSNSNEQPQTVQPSVTFDGEVKESPTAEIVEVEKVEEVNEAPIVANEEVKAPKAPIVEEVSNETSPLPNEQPVSEPKNEIVWISGSLKDTPNPPCKPAKVVMQTHTDESWNELIKTKPGGLMMTIRSGTGQFFCSYIQESK